jgi:hypothetical protein
MYRLMVNLAFPLGVHRPNPILKPSLIFGNLGARNRPHSLAVEQRAACGATTGLCNLPLSGQNAPGQWKLSNFCPTKMDRSIRLRPSASIRGTAPTGVEMEALTAVQVGLLTIYDMCKAADRGMVMTDVRLLEKQGGKSGHWVAP